MTTAAVMTRLPDGGDDGGNVASGRRRRRRRCHATSDDGGDVAPQYRADIGAYMGGSGWRATCKMQTLYDREGGRYQPMPWRMGALQSG